MQAGFRRRACISSTLVGMLALLAGAFLKIMVLIYAGKGQDENSKLLTCKLFSAYYAYSESKIRQFGAKLTGSFLGFGGAGRGCSTIEKKGKDALPGEEYRQNKDGIIDNVADIMVNCWGEWLDGRYKNMFDGTIYDDIDKGFICYKFTIKDVDDLGGHVNIGELAQPNKGLLKPHYAVDKTDKCMGAWGGGLCGIEIEGRCVPSRTDIDFPRGSDYFSRAEDTDRCGKLPDGAFKKCCVAASPIDECKNMGGRCLSEPLVESGYTFEYPVWKCGSKTCYVKEDSIVSVLSYIQGTDGSDTGPGAVVFLNPQLQFRPGVEYAISFVSPGSDATPGSYLALGAAVPVAIIGSKFFAAATAVSSSLAWLGVGLADGLISGYAATYLGEVNDLNFIVVSEYNDVQGVYSESADS
ncbi:hypothetical protein HYT54_02625 [Candidatus Woesearchaeota archaeon]|nr:hypothetical protein [Candidatus Woesearchaeota archaeon]